MPTFEEAVKITRRGKGKRRRSNIISKWLARRAAEKDMNADASKKQ